MTDRSTTRAAVTSELRPDEAEPLSVLVSGGVPGTQVVWPAGGRHGAGRGDTDPPLLGPIGALSPLDTCTQIILQDNDQEMATNGSPLGFLGVN